MTNPSTVFFLPGSFLNGLQIVNSMSGLSLAEIDHPTSKDVDHKYKLLSGLLYSLKKFIIKISPFPCDEDVQGKLVSNSFIDEVLSYSTDYYKLHFYESPTGYQFVLITEPNVPNLIDTVFHIYSSIFVDTIVRNPLSNHRLLHLSEYPNKEDISGLSLDCNSFRSKLTLFFSTL